MDSLIHVVYIGVMYFKDTINSDNHIQYLETSKVFINLIRFSKKLAIKIRINNKIRITTMVKG